MANTFQKTLQSLTPLLHFKNLFLYFLFCPGDSVDSVDFSSAQNGILRQFSADMEKGRESFIPKGGKELSPQTGTVFQCFKCK
jgi:hypothetical protein